MEQAITRDADTNSRLKTPWIARELRRRLVAAAARATSALLACAGLALTLGAVSLFAASASSYAEPMSYTTGSGPVSVAIGDLNRDGKPDLATANLYVNTVSVLFGSGDGSFTSRRNYRAGGDPRSVAIGDLNGDGKPDLAAASNDASVISVFLSKATAASGRGATTRPGLARYQSRSAT